MSVLMPNVAAAVGVAVVGLGVAGVVIHPRVELVGVLVPGSDVLL